MKYTLYILLYINLEYLIGRSINCFTGYCNVLLIFSPISLLPNIRESRYFHNDVLSFIVRPTFVSCIRVPFRPHTRQSKRFGQINYCLENAAYRVRRLRKLQKLKRKVGAIDNEVYKRSEQDQRAVPLRHSKRTTRYRFLNNNNRIRRNEQNMGLNTVLAPIKNKSNTINGMKFFVTLMCVVGTRQALITHNLMWKCANSTFVKCYRLVTSMFYVLRTNRVTGSRDIWRRQRAVDLLQASVSNITAKFWRTQTCDHYVHLMQCKWIINIFLSVVLYLV